MWANGANCTVVPSVLDWDPPSSFKVHQFNVEYCLTAGSTALHCCVQSYSTLVLWTVIRAD